VPIAIRVIFVRQSGDEERKMLLPQVCPIGVHQNTQGLLEIMRGLQIEGGVLSLIIKRGPKIDSR
jgi:hypothetical protein